MDYKRKTSSLEERASAQVAINLCQGNDFKELAMCLEKPTYGGFISESESYFVTDPEELFRYTKMKKDAMKLADLKFLFFSKKKDLDELAIERWDAGIEKQCQILTEEFPHFLKHGVHAWIKRIALEYLSYGKRQEEHFGVSRYFLMNVLTPADWTASGRLDEKQIGERFLQDERLTVLQRYRIACVNFLHVPELWKRLTQEEKKWINENGNSQEVHRLVFLSSCLMNGQGDEKIIGQEKYLWVSATKPALFYGNRAALMSCWKKLKQHLRKRMVIDMALESLQLWQFLKYSRWRKDLISNCLDDVESYPLRRSFCLPIYYSELLCFFLSEMDEEQQFTFFNKAFQYAYSNLILECFLDWPHQDDFLPTINRLWGIIPKNSYARCLLTLTSKYSRNHEKENCYFDYGSLLWMLWENTPEEYKQQVFRNQRTNNVLFYEDKGMVILRLLLEKSPFQEKDETFFKGVFCHQSQEERKAMMHCNVGENICSILVRNENWSFVNWLLEECLPKEEIPCYKKQLIRLYCCEEHCCSELEKNNWSYEISYNDCALWTEKMQTNYKPVRKAFFVYECAKLLCKGNFIHAERMISFCLTSDEIKEHIKVHFAIYICTALLKREMDDERLVKAEDFVSVCEHMNAILAWSVDSERKKRNLKKDLFSRDGINAHYKLLFRKNQLEDVACFYKWFGLSPKEIEKLKKDTVFTPDVIKCIEEALYGSTDMLIAPLRWCLTDQKVVFDLKKKVEENFLKQPLDKKREAKEQLDYLVRELLYYFKREEFQDKANREGDFMKEKKGEKRSFIAKNESRSRRKRFK